MAGASRVGVESDPGMAAEGRYEGRLTTAREGMLTVQIERSGRTSEHIESVSEANKRNGLLRDSK